MSQNIDDIWEALKASTAPRDGRASGRASSAVLATMFQPAERRECQQDNADHANVASGISKHCPSKRVQSFTQRDVNCLSDPDRNLRKQAIKKLYTQIGSTSVESWDRGLIALLESEALREKILHMLGDQTDVCREVAMEVISILVSAAPDENVLKLQALQALKHRMGVGQACPLEPSEEIRLKIAKFTTAVMVAKAINDDAVIDDVAHILSRCLDDSFHETKKCACMGVTSLARTSPHGQLAHVCGLIVTSLVEVLRHPHSRVRAAGMQALMSLGENTPFSRELLATKLVPALRMTAVDKSCDLRLATFRACASWLEIHMADVGCSWFMPHLLPVLLLGITDGRPDAGVETLAMLSQVAHKFSPEQDGICNEMDQVEHAWGADAPAGTSLPPPLDRQASAALCTMINAQLDTILPPVLDDVKQWTATLRSTASRCLYSIMALSKHGLTRYLERILPCLCQAVGDDDEAVTIRIVHCIHVVGTFCEVHHWMPLILEYVSTLKAQQNATVCALVAMSGLALAAGRASKPVRMEHLEQMAEWLASEEMRSMQHVELQRQLVMVVANVIDLAGPAVIEVAKPLFHSLVHLQGYDFDSYTINQIQVSQDILATACGFASASELAAQYASSLMTRLLQQSRQWCTDHPDIPSFLTMLRISPGETISAVGQPLCEALSCIIRDHERDPALRMSLLRGIDSLLQNEKQGHVFCGQHGLLLLETVIIPPLIWRAGKSAAAVRYSALHALHTLFFLRHIGPEALKPFLSPQGKLLPLLFQSMDEDWYVDTRRLACCTVAALFQLAGSELSDDSRRQIYPELNKRMDDSNNAVRITAAVAVQAFAHYAMSPTYCDTNSGYFISAFLIHLDDADEEVQTAVLAALQELRLKKPAVLKAESCKVYDSFRSKHLLDLLVSAS